MIPKSRYGFTSSLSGDELAEAVPSGSRLLVHVQPSQQLLFLYLRVFGLREELMHGERQQFGLSRSMYLLRRRARRALFQALLNEVAIDDAAAAIVETETVANELTRRRRPFLEAVDQYLTHSVAREDGYLERHADTYADARDEPVEDVVTHLEEVRNRITDQVPNREEVYDRLFEIEETYSRRVAETVADAALDIPYLIEPVEVPGVDSQPVDELDLRTRFSAAYEALSEIEIDPATNRTDLLRAIQRVLRREEIQPEDERTPRDLDIPLLDRPARPLHKTNELREGFETMQSAPDVASIVGASFRLVGNFGGAIYYDPDGRTNWLVNPWVADETVPDASSYAALWERTYVADRLIGQLVARAEEGAEEHLNCPLCTISPGDQCGQESCSYEQYVTLAREKESDLITALRSAGVSP